MVHPPLPVSPMPPSRYRLRSTINCGNAITPAGPTTGGTFNGCTGTRTYTWVYTDCEGNSHNWVYTYTIRPPGLRTVSHQAHPHVSCITDTLHSLYRLRSMTTAAVRLHRSARQLAVPTTVVKAPVPTPGFTRIVVETRKTGFTRTPLTIIRLRL
jgi:hypothetical protein